MKMGEEETKGVDQQEESSAAAAAAAAPTEEKIVRYNESPAKPPPLTDLEKEEADSEIGKPEDRDVALAQVQIQKRLALIKAWEDNEKSKADNKAHKKLSAIDAWENTKRASVEAQLKQIEENIEKKKAEYAEKMKNKAAMVNKAAEEKRATIEADRGKDFLAVEEAASKFRATGSIPNKFFACFSC